LSIGVGFIRSLPKADLHSHIDGTIPLKQLFSMAARHKRIIRTRKGIPITSVSSFLDHIRGDGYGGLLEDIVDRFYPITALMQTEDILFEVGRAYVAEMSGDGVSYAEGRFAPQYHIREGLTLEQVVKSMLEGFRAGTEETEVKVNLIVAIGRETDPRFACDIVAAAAKFHDRGVVGVDIGGSEKGNPPGRFEAAFKLASEFKLHRTVHVGEGAGSLSQNLRNIHASILKLGAERIGHAIDLASSESLTELVIRRGVTVEMNPISNHVLHKIRNLRDLRIDYLLDRGVRVTVNSDDPALWKNGKLSQVLAAVCRSYGFRRSELDQLIINSFEGSFAKPNEKEELRQRVSRGAARERLRRNA
jgi:adenosine deaminase